MLGTRGNKWLDLPDGTGLRQDLPGSAQGHLPGRGPKLLGIPAGQYKPLPADLQYTSEREADQVWQISPQLGEAFILHCEFQTSNDRQMLSRMLIYHAFLHYQHKRPIRQFVVYVGKDKPNMEHRLVSPAIFYHYDLVDLRSFPYQTFLESSQGQEVLLAILADYGGEPAELIAERILVKLEQVTQSKLQLEQRVLQLVRLAVLRNVNTTVFNVAQNMALNIDIKDDTLYQLGEEKGLQEGLQKGLQEGLQKGLQQGQEEGKEKAALNMLKDGFPPETVARLAELPLERVMQLKLERDASRKDS
jgi:predicted transposase/invertase (TIGR01784 family)